MRSSDVAIVDIVQEMLKMAELWHETIHDSSKTELFIYTPMIPTVHLVQPVIKWRHKFGYDASASMCCCYTKLDDREQTQTKRWQNWRYIDMLTTVDM